MTSLLRSLYCASFALLAACSSSASGDSQSSDGTVPSATGTAPETFCKKNCIAEDHDMCMAFATRFSDAFLAAYEQCGDVPSCVEPKTLAAPKTDRQKKLAADYCAKCGDGPSCADSFYTKDGPGGPIVQLSDARLDQVEAQCLDKEDGGQKLICRADFAVCIIPILEEDLKNTAICHTTR